MNDILSIKWSIENNSSYRKKYLTHLKTGLKPYQIQYDDITLEQLLLEAVENHKYTDKRLFYFETLLYIKEKLENKIINEEKEEKNIPINQTNDVKPTKKQKVKSSNSNRQKFKPIEKVIDKDVKFLKCYYQLHDNRYYTHKEIMDIMNMHSKSTSGVVRKKINRILSRMEQDISYKNAIIEHYPSFEKDRQQRQTAKLSKTCSSFDNDVLFLKTYYQMHNGRYYSSIEIAEILNMNTNVKDIDDNIRSKKKDIFKKLNKDINYHNAIIEKYPSFEEDKLKKEKFIINMSIEKDVLFLKAFYQVHDEKYYSPIEIAKIAGMNVNVKNIEESVISKNNYILKKMTENKDYYKSIIEKYPTFEEDKQKRIKFFDTIAAEKDILFLKVYYKKDNGKYLSSLEVAKRTNMNLGVENIENAVRDKKNYILRKMKNNRDYSKIIKENYPDFNYDKKVRDKELKREYYPSVDDILQKDVLFLKCFYQIHDGNYYNNMQIAKIVGMSLNNVNSSVSSKRRHIFKRFKKDKEYKKAILKEYPELYEDKNIKDKLNQDINLLKLIYKLHNCRYYSFPEIDEILQVKRKVSQKRRENLFKKMEKLPKYKSAILSKYPELEQDIILKNNTIGNGLSKEEKAFADLFYTDKTITVLFDDEFAKKLNIPTESFRLFKKSVPMKLKSNPNINNCYINFELQQEVLNQYRKTRSISLSEGEIKNIKNNANSYDENIKTKSTRDNLIKGINKLEKSEYHDFISCCNMKQKSMLALRLGFFNQTIFSTSQIAKLFDVDDQVVSNLTNDCLKSIKKEETQKINIKK